MRRPPTPSRCCLWPGRRRAVWERGKGAARHSAGDSGIAGRAAGRGLPGRLPEPALAESPRRARSEGARAPRPSLRAASPELTGPWSRCRGGSGARTPAGRCRPTGACRPRRSGAPPARGRVGRGRGGAAGRGGRVADVRARGAAGGSNARSTVQRGAQCRCGGRGRARGAARGRDKDLDDESRLRAVKDAAVVTLRHRTGSGNGRSCKNGVRDD